MSSLSQEITCLVFRTDLQDRTAVVRVASALDNIPGIKDWSVDLGNWEKVLRVVGTDLQPQQIIRLLRRLDVKIQEMPI